MSRTCSLLLSIALLACGSKPAARAPEAAAPGPAAADDDVPTCCCAYVEKTGDDANDNYEMMSKAGCDDAAGSCTEATWCSATDE